MDGSVEEFCSLSSGANGSNGFDAKYTSGAKGSALVACDWSLAGANGSNGASTNVGLAGCAMFSELKLSLEKSSARSK